MTIVRLLTVLLPLSLLLTACSDNQTAPAPAPQDPAVIRPGSELHQRLKTEAVTTAMLSDTLKVAGRFDFNEQKVARIGAPVTGRVTDILASAGQAVRAGDVLARINSTELTTAQLAFLKARSARELAYRAAERADTLFAADVISRAELQRRKTEFEVADAELHAARDQLQILGMPSRELAVLERSGQIASESMVSATLPGTVVDRKIARGQVVQPADALFTIADLRHLWAIAQVPEQQVQGIKVGQMLTIEVPALNHERIESRIIYVGDVVNPDTRTVVVRTEIDNRDGRLKPAMLASMLIAARPAPKLVVPNSAVIRENDEDYVFISQDKDEFRLRKVRLGNETGGLRPVLEGLKAGEVIVTEGGFHLNNERRKRLAGG